MREVSQKWLNNQNKTLRDQGLLRLDFLSAHDNNAYAHIIPMGSDASKSNINEIKEIYPYGAPTKNLAMPDLMGKTEISEGIYRLYDANGITFDYNVNNGEYKINGTTTGNTEDVIFNVLPNTQYTVSYIAISGTLFGGVINLYVHSPTITVIQQYNQNINKQNTFTTTIQTMFRFQISAGRIFDNYTFKLQIEQGTEATPYEIPQPNTGYVSTAITNTDGTLTPAGSDYYTLDQPIAELNNHTLREVFEDNNAILNSSLTLTSGVIRNNNNFLLNYNGTSRDVGFRFDLLFSSGSHMYISYHRKGYTTNNYNFQIFDYETFDNALAISLLRSNAGTYEQRYSTITQINRNGARFFPRSYTGDINVELNDYVIIDLTSLGIDNLTVEEMDYWFSVYQAARVVPIEVNVENYRSPLNGITITWSENFGHAVDYSIEYNGEIYTYLNNTKKTVFVPIIVENTPDANFKIRVNKWSQGGVPIRIERVFVGLHIINYQDRIFSYSKKRVNDVLSLELPQDEIHFELSNIDRMFDPLWYNSYFKYLNEKTEIRVYSGFRLDGKNAEWIKNGTFYLTDWKAPNNSITASFTARDILNLLDADEMYSKSGALTLDDYCDIILGRDYKGVDDFEDYNLPVNPDGSKKWNIRKNLAVPDLTGKPEISEGVYRIYDANGITVDYDYWTGEFTINGTPTTISLGGIFSIPTLQDDFEYTISRIYVSGTKTSIVNIYMGFPTQQILENTQNQNTFIAGNDNRTFIFSDLNMGGTFNDYKFKLQLEKGAEATDYELPIENANVPVSMETRTKREVLQLLAQSVNAHIHLDDDANISFIREVTGQQLNADKKIMLTKPEFNIAAPVKKIIVPISTYTSDPNELELARIQVTVDEPSRNLAMPDLAGKPEISVGVYRLYDNNGITIDYEVSSGIFTVDGTNTSYIDYDITPIIPAGVYSASSYYVSGSIDVGEFFIEDTFSVLTIGHDTSDYNTNKTVSEYADDGDFNMSINIYQANSTFNQYKFKYQLEEGSVATDYVVPKPNTGELIEINHDLPYSGGRVEVSGSLTVVSQDNTWYRSYKILVGGLGSGELVLYRHQMARTTINILQDVGSSGTTMTYENPMIDTKLKGSRALTKIWSEISNNRQVEFDLRIDPLFNTLDIASFPFKVLDLEQSEFMRIDELEINYNGAYKGKIKGVILSGYGGDLTDKTYIKHSKEFNSGEENLKWHLLNK